MNKSKLNQDYKLFWYWQQSQNVKEFGSEDNKFGGWTERAELRLKYSPSGAFKKILSQARNGHHGLLSLLLGVEPGYVTSIQIANELLGLLMRSKPEYDGIYYPIGLKPSMKSKLMEVLKILDDVDDFESIIAITLISSGHCFKGIKDKISKNAIKLLEDSGLMMKLSKIEALSDEQRKSEKKSTTTTFLRARAIIVTQDDPSQDPMKLLKASEDELMELFKNHDDRFSRATIWMKRTQELSSIKVQMSDFWFKQNHHKEKTQLNRYSDEEVSEYDLHVNHNSKENTIRLKNVATTSIRVKFKIGLAKHQIVLHPGKEEQFVTQGKLCWINDQAVKHSGTYTYKRSEGFIEQWIPTDDFQVSQGSLAYYILSTPNQIIVINKLDYDVDLPIMTEDGWRHITVYSGKTRIMKFKWTLKSIIRESIKLETLITMTSEEYKHATRKTPIYEGRIHYETDSSDTDDSDDNASYDDY